MSTPGGMCGTGGRSADPEECGEEVEEAEDEEEDEEESEREDDGLTPLLPTGGKSNAVAFRARGRVEDCGLKGKKF